MRAMGVAIMWRPTLAKELLPKPALKYSDLAAHRAMGDSKLRRRLGVAVGAGGDLEHAQGIERRQTAHDNP
jgi:hypothetical protein